MKKNMNKTIIGGKSGEGGSNTVHAHKDYLSIENTNCIKGIFAMCVLIHHLYQYSGLFRTGYSLYLGYCFQALGFFSVAVFFFLSGYGLMASQNKSTKAVFLRKKIVPFYVIICIFTFMYFVFDLIIGRAVSINEIIKSVSFGGTIIANGWYLQVQLLYYVFFLIVCKISSDRKKQLVWMTLLHVGYIAVCLVFDLSTQLYERTLVFVFGMLWFEEKDRIDKWLNNRISYSLIFGSSFILFSAFYILTDFVNNNSLLIALGRSLSYPFFIVLIMCIVYRININNRCTQFLGKISLEIYVVQGFFLNIFHSNLLNIENPILYTSCVFVSTIITAMVIHPAVRCIYKLFSGTNRKMC